MEDFLSKTYFNNTIKQYIIAIGIIVISILLIRVFRSIVLRRLKAWSKKTETNYDDLVVSTVERFGMPALNLLAIYWGVSSLTLTDLADRIVEIATAIAIAFFLIRLVSQTAKFGLEGYVRRQENGEEKVKQMRGVILILNGFIWGFGLLILFSNLGYDVTAIIAGLGVGGIAIALAAQNILGDLFNYFVIFFDRPFEVGDFIIIDTKMGTVEHIGVKTTRLKSLSGEQLVFSNSDLTNSRIHNFKRMSRRRIVFTVGVTYDTPAEKLKVLPEIIKKAINTHSNTTFDRSHFSSFGDFSLNFETVYFVESSEYNVYMDVQQQINMDLVNEFAALGVEFAFPTQTLYVTNTKQA